MAGPLHGIKVLDVGTYGVGPGGAALMGFLGATVVRIENPAGDPFFDVQPTVGGMGGSYINSNMHKKSVFMNLKDPDGVRNARHLARWADVLMENRLPGVMERLGLGYADVVAENPSIIYVSSPGFGSTGPYAGRPALDTYVQALSGFASVEGAEGGEGELFRVFAHLDHTAGVAMVQAAVLGLITRAKSGAGLHIEVWHFTSAIFTQLNRIAEFLVSGQDPPRLGSAVPNLVPSQSFRCQDGRFVNVTVPDQECWSAFCTALGLDELRDDERFLSNTRRRENRPALTAIIGKRTSEAPAWWWVLYLKRHRIPCGPVYAPDEVLRDATLVRESIEEVETAWGPVWHARHPWRFSDTPCGPMLGTHIPGSDEAEVAAMLEPKAASAG